MQAKGAVAKKPYRLPEDHEMFTRLSELLIDSKLTKKKKETRRKPFLNKCYFRGGFFFSSKLQELGKKTLRLVVASEIKIEY